MEEVLRLRRQFALSFAEDLFRLLAGDAFCAQLEVVVTPTLPVVVILLVGEGVVPAIASPVLPTITTLWFRDSVASLQVVNASADDFADTVGDDITQSDVPGIEPHIDPIVVVFCMYLTQYEPPGFQSPGRVMGLGTEVAEQQSLLGLASTGGSTADGVDLAVHDVLQQLGIQIHNSLLG